MLGQQSLVLYTTKNTPGARKRHAKHSNAQVKVTFAQGLTCFCASLTGSPILG